MAGEVKNTANTNYNWYPGHMTKAKRMMEEDIKLIDLVIELVDARIPLSSRNPNIDSLAHNKSRIILLNKSDLADEVVTDKWIEYFKDKGFFCLKLNSHTNNANRAVNNLVQQACKDKLEKNRARGIINKPVRAMIVGIPNVGKSTFINTYAGKKSAKTGNKPGVTKGKQWIKLRDNIELLDTPGILWPKFDNKEVGKRLAMIGSMNDEILNIEELALEIIKYISLKYPSLLMERYSYSEEDINNSVRDYEMVSSSENREALAIMEHIASKRGCIKRGGLVDYERVANCVIDDFRSGKIGRISLENAEDY